MKHPLDLSWLYRAWQAPFVEQKLVPLRRRHPGLPFRRVLDLGCGPGTNAGAFLKSNYLGIDLNAGYIDSARRRFGDRFMMGDASRLQVPAGLRFDCILINSLLHHLSDEQVGSLLRGAGDLLTPDGLVFVIDMYAPDARGAARSLALADRGEHVRTLRQLRRVVGADADVQHDETYALRIAGIDLWAMAYFEARPRGPTCA